MEKTVVPLLFTFRVPVYGNGFLAGIVVKGNALAHREDQGVWLDGVRPGDVSAGGTTLLEAFVEFERDLTAVLYDIAADAEDFKSFKTSVETFFARVAPGQLEAWDDAVNRVRAGWSPDLAQGLPRCSADDRRVIEVSLIVSTEAQEGRVLSFSPSENKLDREPALAA